MPATLRLIRQGVGIELRRGPFEVLIDNKAVATINQGDEIEIHLEPGHHLLRVRSGRYSSRNDAFETTNDQPVDFRCHGAMMWPRYIASLIKPDLALSLHRQ